MRHMRGNYTQLIGIGLVILVLVLVPGEFAHAQTSAWLNPLSWLGGKVLDGIAGLVWGITSVVGALFLSIGGWFLDTSISWLVVRMGELYNGNLGVVVELGWTIIRDLLNMCFIFALIYIGIRTILNSEDSGTRRALGYLIAAALLINFSLYITQVVVDFTNLLATQVYNQITTASGSNPTESRIAHGFIDVSGLSGWFSSDSVQAGAVNQLGFGAKIFYYVMMMFFFVIAGFMFILGAIMIVTRFVALLLYMMFSPLMFIGWILPYFKQMSKDWWQGFFRYAFFGPIYVLMLYFSLRILEGLTLTFRRLNAGDQEAGVWGAIASNGQQMSFIVMFFAIMVGFLYASLKVGDKLSIAGGKMTSNMVEGYAYRNTVGWAADRAQKTYDLVDRTTGGALTKAGGEQFRRSIVKTKEYSVPGSYGRAEGETMVKEASARRARGNTLADFKATGNTAAYLRGDKRDGLKLAISDAQLLEVMEKDPKKRDEILTSHPELLPPSVIKSILEDDKDRFNDAVKSKVARAKGTIGDVLRQQAEDNKNSEATADYIKRVKKDAKEVAELFDATDMTKNAHVIEAIATDPGLVGKVGEHLPRGIDREKLKNELNAAAKKATGKDLKKSFKQSRFW